MNAAMAIGGRVGEGIARVVCLLIHSVGFTLAVIVQLLPAISALAAIYVVLRLVPWASYH